LAPDGRPLADFSDRLLARLIDWAVMFAVRTLIGIPAMIAIVVINTNADQVRPDGTLTEPGLGSAYGPVISIYCGFLLLAVLASYLYEVEWVLRHNGQTVGKRVMKIGVVPLAPGTRLTRGRYAKRWGMELAYTIVFPGLILIDGLWQLWDRPYRQCRHDKWPGTTVVKLST
jgi:uncharacterized RDD family membrane protein YckC